MVRMEIILENGQHATLDTRPDKLMDFIIEELTLEKLDLFAVEMVKEILQLQPELVKPELIQRIDQIIEQKRAEKKQTDEAFNQIMQTLQQTAPIIIHSTPQLQPSQPSQPPSTPSGGGGSGGGTSPTLLPIQFMSTFDVNNKTMLAAISEQWNFEVNPADLMISTASSNPSVATMSFSGSNANRVGTLTSGSPGTTTITINATKSGYSSFSRSFTVTVVEPNASINPSVVPLELGFLAKQSSFTVTLVDGEFVASNPPTIIDQSKITLGGVLNPGIPVVDIEHFFINDYPTNKTATFTFDHTKYYPEIGIGTVTIAADAWTGPEDILLDIYYTNPIGNLSARNGAVDSGMVELEWDTPEGATQVRLMVSEGSSSTGFTYASWLPEVAANADSVEITSLLPGKSYWFKLDVVGGLNQGNSNVVHFVPLTTFAGGDGLTSGSAFLVSNVAQLNNIRNYLDTPYYFEQTADIDLSSIPNWVPIGSLAKSFKGTYNGMNKTISNLHINQEELHYVGLFGYGNSASIKNLRINNATVVGGVSDTGILAGGFENNSHVTNINISNSSVSNGRFVGGLVGEAHTSTISDSTVSASIASTYDDNNFPPGTGGIIGYAYSTNKNKLSFSGTVNGVDNVGGIIGRNHVGSCSNAYSMGTITGRNVVGGLIGELFAGSITNCYSSATITGRANVGGLIGQMYSSQLTNSYALNEHIIRESGSSDPTFGRIVGDKDSSTLGENRANSAMAEPFFGAFNDKSIEGKDGKDISNWMIDASGFIVTPIPSSEWRIAIIAGHEDLFHGSTNIENKTLVFNNGSPVTVADLFAAIKAADNSEQLYEVRSEINLIQSPSKELGNDFMLIVTSEDGIEHTYNIQFF